MKCERCGETYPSQFYFVKEGGTMRRLCTKCESSMATAAADAFVTGADLVQKRVANEMEPQKTVGRVLANGGLPMTTIPDEKVLLQSGGLTLTTHRVRSEAERGGKMQITSIMLEELCSCEIRFTSNSLLLKLGGLLAALGIVIGIMSSDAFQHIFDLYDDAYVSWSQAILLLGVILVAIYFATRKEVISLASAAARINLQRRQSGQQEAKQLIDQIEAAKNQRYLLARAAANEA